MGAGFFIYRKDNMRLKLKIHEIDGIIKYMTENEWRGTNETTDD